jgi:hypothetical protein
VGEVGRRGLENDLPVLAGLEGLAPAGDDGVDGRVRSTAYRTANTIARAALKAMVVVSSGTPALSTRLSVIRVPTMLINTTASQ